MAKTTTPADEEGMRLLPRRGRPHRLQDLNLLRKYISDRGKIRARRVTGNCTQHQRDIATAVKNAREMAMLPLHLDCPLVAAANRTGLKMKPSPTRKSMASEHPVTSLRSKTATAVTTRAPQPCVPVEQGRREADHSDQACT